MRHRNCFGVISCLHLCQIQICVVKMHVKEGGGGGRFPSHMGLADSKTWKLLPRHQLPSLVSNLDQFWKNTCGVGGERGQSARYRM